MGGLVAAWLACGRDRCDRPTQTTTIVTGIIQGVVRRPDTERTCLAVGPTQFTLPYQTRQNSHVYAVSGVAGGVNWTIAVNVFRVHSFWRRQHCIVDNRHRTNSGVAV